MEPEQRIALRERGGDVVLLLDEEGNVTRRYPMDDGTATPDEGSA